MFTDTTSAPKVMLTGFRYRQTAHYYIVDSSAPKGYERTITEENFEFRGLSFTAADSIAGTYKAKTTGDSNVYDANWQQQAPPGWYKVCVTHKQVSTWTAIT